MKFVENFGGNFLANSGIFGEKSDNG